MSTVIEDEQQSGSGGGLKVIGALLGIGLLGYAFLQSKPVPQVQSTTAQHIAISTNSSYPDIARADALKYGIRPDLFVKQINQESGFQVNVTSPSGAIGIAQFMPATASSLGVDPNDPISSLDGAAKLMASLSRSYDGDYDKALAAYNSGSGTVNACIASDGDNWEQCLPTETQNYI